MADLTDFKNFIADLLGSSTYTNWAKNHATDAAAFVTYYKAILAGETPTAPTMTTVFGKALVESGLLALAGVDPTPPPPPPPPPSTGAWAWDATQGTVKSNSASLVKDFLTYCGPLAYFFIEVAHAVRESNTSVYQVSTSGKPGALDATLYVPVGAKGGLSNDQHLWIEDRVTGRWHDLDGVSFSNGKLISWRFGSSMDAGVVQVPHVPNKTSQGATAAMFPLARGTVTPEEIASGSIPHALAFVAANLGPSPNPYPANTQVGYSSGNQPSGSDVSGHIPLGTWMRLPPSLTIPPAASKFEKMVFECLQKYGMFCRDRGSTLSLHGQDLGGGGTSITAWRNAGVDLSDTGLLKLSNIPWSQLQVLDAPPII